LIPSNDEEFVVGKRQLDNRARATIPLFRGSNLSMFIRKRPLDVINERAIHRVQETRSTSPYDDKLFADLFNDEQQHTQRRFDEYSENPGPMFG
jgi:hypothetical protein